MLGIRFSSTPQISAANIPRGLQGGNQTGEDMNRRLIQNLLSRHQALQSRIKHYNMALITAKQVHRDANQVHMLITYLPCPNIC